MALSDSQIREIGNSMRKNGQSVLKYDPDGDPDQPYKQKYPGSTGGKVSSGKLPLSGGNTLLRLQVEAFLAGAWQPEYRTEYDLNFGWNTRATLSQPILPGTIIRFRIPAYSTGVVVGLTAAPKEAGYGDIEFGIMQSVVPGSVVDDPGTDTNAPAALKLVKGGVAYVPVEPDVSEDIAFAFSFLAAGEGYRADLFPLQTDGLSGRHELRVLADRVEYWVRYQDDGDPYMLYSYAAPFNPNWKLSAALYSGGDKVWDLSISRDFADLQTPRVKVFSTDVADLSSAALSIPSITASGEDFIESTSADISLPKIQAFGGDDATVAYIETPRVRVSGIDGYENDPPVDLTFGTLRPPSVQVRAKANDITFASADIAIPKAALFGSDAADVTFGRLDAPAIKVWAKDLPNPGRVDMITFVYLIHAVAGFEAYYIVWTERQGVVGLLSATEVENALIQSQANASDSLTANEILQALLSSVMSAADVAALTGQSMQVWALHMDAMGSTRYDGYNFNSFATIDGVTYGAADDGVYRLDGNDDAGTDIQSLVDFGSLNFGTNNRKALPYVYVGMAANGKTVLKVESDGKTYFYEIRDATEGMKTHRFELGRGLRSTFYGVTLISEGPAFDLHNIEFQPIELTRRL